MQWNQIDATLGSSAVLPVTYLVTIFCDALTVDRGGGKSVHPWLLGLSDINRNSSVPHRADVVRSRDSHSRGCDLLGMYARSTIVGTRARRIGISA